MSAKRPNSIARTDRRSNHADQDMTRPLDAFVDLDEAILQPEDVTVIPMDSGVPDYVVDVDPNVEPSRNEYTIIGGGDYTRMVWWRGGRLLSRVFTAQVMPANEGGPPPLGPIDPTQVEIIAGPVVELGYYPPYEGGLRGIRAPSSADGHLALFLAR